MDETMLFIIAVCSIYTAFTVKQIWEQMVEDALKRDGVEESI